MEPDAALVGADGVVVLDTPAALDSDIAVVVLPADPEADHSIGFGNAPQDLVLVILHLVLDVPEDVFGDLADSLDELWLSRVAPLDSLNELFKVDVVGCAHRSSPLLIGRVARDHLRRHCRSREYPGGTIQASRCG